MFRWATLDCTVCGASVERHDVVLTLGTPRVAICRDCYDEWNAAGRLCAACQTSVRRDHEVGVFLERRGLGHAHCGG